MNEPKQLRDFNKIMIYQKFRRAIRTLARPLLWMIYRWYLSKDRWYHYDGLRIKVNKSVFHPGLLLSSKILTRFAARQKVEGKSVLELSAGSGMLALAASRRGAMVTASDINPAAVASMLESCQANNLIMMIIESDMFDSIAVREFDYIFINPPFYPKEPKNVREMAFFCGKDHAYFKKLFQQLPAYIHSDTKIFMILTDDCDISGIRQIGGDHGFAMERAEQYRQLGEEHFVFQLSAC